MKATTRLIHQMNMLTAQIDQFCQQFNAAKSNQSSQPKPASFIPNQNTNPTLIK